MDSRKELDYDYNQPVDVEIDDQTSDEEKKEFVDPATATPILLFILENLMKAVVTFFTMKFLENWWKKYRKTDEALEEEEKKANEPGD